MTLRAPTPLLRRRWAIGLALAALLFAQWMGLVHAIGHGPAGAQRVAPLQQGSSINGVLDAVTAHVDGSLACQLFDHLVLPAPPAQASAWATPTLPPAQPPVTAHEPVPGGVTAGYHARGPPAHA